MYHPFRRSLVTNGSVAFCEPLGKVRGVRHVPSFGRTSSQSEISLAKAHWFSAVFPAFFCVYCSVTTRTSSLKQGWHGRSFTTRDPCSRTPSSTCAPRASHPAHWRYICLGLRDVIPSVLLNLPPLLSSYVVGNFFPLFENVTGFFLAAQVIFLRLCGMDN